MWLHRKRVQIVTKLSVFCVTTIIMEHAIILLKRGSHQSCLGCCWSPLPLPRASGWPHSCQFRLGLETYRASRSPLPSASEANYNLGGVFGAFGCTIWSKQGSLSLIMVQVMPVFGLLAFSKPTRRLTHQPPTSVAALVALLLLFFQTSLGALAVL